MHLFVVLMLILFFINIISISQSQELNLILAVDTSGSTSIGNYLPSVSEGIELFLKDLNKTMPKVNVGLVSWDDNIDFIIKPNLDHTRTSKLIGKLSSRREEMTDFKQAMIGAKMAINEIDCCYCKNIVIIINDRSEFSRSNYHLDKTKYMVNSLYISDGVLEPSSPLFVYLKSLTNEYNGTVSTFVMDSRFIAKNLFNIAVDNAIKLIPDVSGSNRVIINNSMINKIIADTTTSKTICISNFIIDDNLTLKTNINQRLIFYNCIFNGSVSIIDSIFKDSVVFDKCYFDKDASCNIYNSYFFSSVDLINSVFDSPIDICDSVFNGRSSFQNTKFNSSSKFENLIFKGDTIFCTSYFGDDVSFYLSNFNSIADFSKTYLMGRSSFNRTIFLGPVSFEDSEFTNASSFLLSRFDNDTTFKNANFHKNTSFRSAIFAKSISFRNSNFMNLADFGLVSFNGSTDFGYSNFRGTFELTKTKINYLENFIWPYFINKIKCDDQVTFSELIRNFRNLRNFEAANEMYFQYCELEGIG